MSTLTLNKRRPLDDEQPDGYLESDNDFIANNMELVMALLEAFEAGGAHVKWVVTAGSGHGGPRRFDHEDEARGYYDQQAEINSYIGTGKQHASIHRETIIVDQVTRNR